NDIRLNYRKRLNRKGASMNVHITNSNTSSDSENNFNEVTQFCLEDSTVNVNQVRLGDNKSHNFSTQLSFNNTISTKVNYSIAYNFSHANSQNYTDVFNFDDNNIATEIDTTYSRQQNDRNTNQGINAQANLNFEPFRLNVSNRTTYRVQNLEDAYRAIDLSRDFWDNNLNMDLHYQLSTRKTLRLSYQNGNIIPTFEQLQPFQPQTNTLFRQEGNPDLRRATRNSFRLNYHTLSLLKGTNLSLNGDISFVKNPIINKREIDNNRVTTSSFVNINDRSSWQASINGNFNKPVFNKQVQFNIFSGVNYNNGFSYIRYNN